MSYRYRDAFLTPREYDIIQLVAEGLTNKQIANKLSVVKSSVAKHVAALLLKCHATNRTKLAVDWVKWKYSKQDINMSIMGTLNVRVDPIGVEYPILVHIPVLGNNGG